MKRFLLLLLVFSVMLGMGEVVQALSIDNEVVAELTMKISRAEGLDREEKEELLNTILEGIYAGQIVQEELLNNIDHVINDYGDDAVEYIKLEILSSNIGIKQEVQNFMVGLPDKDVEEIAEIINEALEEGLAQAELSELLQNNQGNLESLEEKVENTISERERLREEAEEREEKDEDEDEENEDDEDELEQDEDKNLDDQDQNDQDDEEEQEDGEENQKGGRKQGREKNQDRAKQDQHNIDRDEDDEQDEEDEDSIED